MLYNCGFRYIIIEVFFFKFNFIKEKFDEN